MNILAIDLANFSSSVALLRGDKVVFQEHSDVFRGQDIALLSRLKKILADQGLSFQDLDRFVTTTGPGSFTGIRVALATAQGISFAADIPALGIGSFQWVLKAYAKQSPKPLPGKTLVLLESMRLELYGQLFDQDGQAVGVPFSLSPEDVLGEPAFEGALCIGNGVKHLPKNATEQGFTIDPFMAQASHLAELSLEIPQADLIDYPCTPVYVREADTGMPKK